MFIKWQTRARRTSAKNLGHLLTCSLVESCRVDGKPRHRVLAYLGGIRDAMPTNHRIAFWQNARHRLDKIDLDHDTRAKVETDIAKRVPYTSEDEREFSHPSAR